MIIDRLKRRHNSTDCEDSLSVDDGKLNESSTKKQRCEVSSIYDYGNVYASMHLLNVGLYDKFIDKL